MADTMKLLVNTPERVFYNDDVTFVELSTSEGEIGIYPNHVPLTAVLVPCVKDSSGWRSKEGCCSWWNSRDTKRPCYSTCRNSRVAG